MSRVLIFIFVMTTALLGFAGLMMLGLLIALLYNRYHARIRHRKELESMRLEISEKNDVLQKENDALQREKDWLVDETQHRVRNNLQMVISLLNAQSEFLKHPSALEAIRESRERMEAIAILHHELYRSGSNAMINMQSYINELTRYIGASQPQDGKIYFQLETADICLDMSQSLPLGMILNEAISNAVKHAYPGEKTGGIHISLQYTGASQLQLKVKDHGKGLARGIDMEPPHSLGMQLIKLFSEQLEGELRIIDNNGVEVDMIFKVTGIQEQL